MDAPHNQVFYPQNFSELFSAWRRFPGAVLYAGGTELIRRQNKHILVLPSSILSLDKIDELRRITRTERYIEIGAMVKLNDIINLGKILPEALSQVLKGIAGPEVRNLATIGGNLCHPTRRLDASAPMIALDARYELRTAASSRWISASRFSSLPGPLALNSQELLTRIRIPLEEWNYTVYKKLGGAIVFIVRIQKNILTDIRIVFSGGTILRDKNSETFLSGKHLPLDKRDVQHFVELWRVYLSAVEGTRPFMQAMLLNFIETSLLFLTD